MKNLQRSGQAHFLRPSSPDSSLKDRSGFEFALCRSRVCSQMWACSQAIGFRCSCSSPSQGHCVWCSLGGGYRARLQIERSGFEFWPESLCFWARPFLSQCLSYQGHEWVPTNCYQGHEWVPTSCYQGYEWVPTNCYQGNTMMQRTANENAAYERRICKRSDQPKIESNKQWWKADTT